MFSIVIQAGGASSRMGRDKGLIPFLGEPLIQRVLKRLEHISDEILVTTNTPQDYQFLGIPLFSDIFPDRGALGGLYTALQAASHPIVAVVACDLPFINARLLVAEKDMLLKTQSDVVVPSASEGLEPLHAIYRSAACLKPVKNALDAGKWRVDVWFDQVDLRIFSNDEILRYDPQFLSFRNVNTPQDLKAAIQIATQLANHESGKHTPEGTQKDH
jgi:molybdopterin-guanine dinucleotide biosynthesis protein A